MFQIQINITQERLNDLLLGHSGSVSPWLKEIKSEEDYFVVVYDDPDKDEGTFTGKATITKNDIEIGLATMATKETYSFTNFLNEEDDDCTFDVAWQCIIFGETVYG